MEPVEKYMVMGSEVKAAPQCAGAYSYEPGDYPEPKPARAHDDIRVGDVFKSPYDNVLVWVIVRREPRAGFVCELVSKNNGFKYLRSHFLCRDIRKWISIGDWIRVEDVPLEQPPAPTFTPNPEPPAKPTEPAFPEGWLVSPPDERGVQRIKAPDGVTVGRCWTSAGVSNNGDLKCKHRSVIVQCDHPRANAFVAVEHVDAAVAYVAQQLERVGGRR